MHNAATSTEGQRLIIFRPLTFNDEHFVEQNPTSSLALLSKNKVVHVFPISS
jgi:hypothetical protein